MVDISSNFSKSEVKHTFICGEIESMKHVNYIHEIINENTVQSEEYENIYNGKISKKIEVFRKFEENLNQYKILKTENQNKCESSPPCDPTVIRCSVKSSKGSQMILFLGQTAYFPLILTDDTISIDTSA